MPKIDGSQDGPLQCPVCREYRKLIFKKIGYTDIGKGIGYNLPFLECEKCEKITPVIPEEYIKEASKKQLAEIPKGYFSIPIKGENKKFDEYESLGFKYDGRDYYYIPGLLRSWNEGFLTPVFFNSDLLLYYNNHPDCRVTLSSFSNVNIYKNKEILLHRGMGINQSGKLFAWLGDLYEVFSDGKNKEDLQRFITSNINSDHDIISDYYFNQIEVNWTESDNEYQIFLLKEIFEKLMLEKYKFKLYKIRITDLNGAYKSPVMNEKDQIFSSYVKLNSFLIENIETGELKKLLLNYVDSEELKKRGSLKLMEYFFKYVLKIEKYNEVACPFFVLNDLRKLHVHLTDNSFEEEYKSCKDRLGIKIEISHLEFFKEVVKSIIKTFGKLNEIIK